MIDGRNVFHEPVKNYIRTYGKVRKVDKSQEDNCATVQL